MKGHAGIDEVGRGPLAGPVTVCAVQWISSEDPTAILNNISDSKKLSPRQRSEWLTLAEKLKDTHLRFAVYSISALEIDCAGIMTALQTAAAETLYLLQKITEVQYVHADYGLPIPKKYPHTHLVKGDEKNPLIALASIIAKEKRDMIMRNLCEQFPIYGFSRHKGYGTKHHREMIQKYGPSPIHRQSFLKNII